MAPCGVTNCFDDEDGGGSGGDGDDDSDVVGGCGVISSPSPVEVVGRVVAVAIENNKTSQYAAKWAVDNLVPRDQCMLLIHIRQRPSSTPTTSNSSFSLSPSPHLINQC